MKHIKRVQQNEIDQSCPTGSASLKVGLVHSICKNSQLLSSGVCPEIFRKKKVFSLFQLQGYSKIAKQYRTTMHFFQTDFQDPKLK